MRSGKLPRYGDRVALGKAKLQVSPFCIGMTRDSNVIEAAFDLGINFFFLSTDLHWGQYESNRVGLKNLFKRPGARDQVVVCASSYMIAATFTHGAFRETVEAIPGLGHIDIVCAGGMYSQDTARRMPILEQFLEQKTFGSRALAASYHEREAARTALVTHSVDAAFVRYNPLHHGGRADLFPLLPSDAAPLFAFKTSDGYVAPEVLKQLGLEDDHWLPSRSDFYRYALTEEKLDGILFSPTQVEHLHQIAGALEKGPLQPEEIEYLETLSLHVHSPPSTDPSVST